MILAWIFTLNRLTPTIALLVIIGCGNDITAKRVSAISCSENWSDDAVTVTYCIKENDGICSASGMTDCLDGEAISSCDYLYRVTHHLDENGEIGNLVTTHNPECPFEPSEIPNLN